MTPLERQRPPQAPWDQWSIWADRGWGKTFAVKEQIRAWGAESKVIPTRIAIVAADIKNAAHELIIAPHGLLRSCPDLEFSHRSLFGSFGRTGTTIMILGAADLERTRGNLFDKLVVDCLDGLNQRELENLGRFWAEGSGKSASAQALYTFEVPPPWPLRRLKGLRRHLTIGAAEVNAAAEAPKKPAASALAYLAQHEVEPGSRWTAGRKLHFLTACRAFPEESEALMQAFGIGAEELSQWIRANERDPHGGLQATMQPSRHR